MKKKYLFKIIALIFIGLGVSSCYERTIRTHISLWTKEFDGKMICRMQAGNNTGNNLKWNEDRDDFIQKCTVNVEFKEYDKYFQSCEIGTTAIIKSGKVAGVCSLSYYGKLYPTDGVRFELVKTDAKYKGELSCKYLCNRKVTW